MAYNTVAIKKDVDGKPIPKYYNPVTNEYGALQELNGASKAILFDENGNPINSKDTTKTLYGLSTDINQVPGTLSEISSLR